MAEWFKDWFNTKYYHILYKNRNFDEAKVFIQNLVKHLKLQPKAHVLDLACGKGRHSIFLNKLGYDVVGVDLSVENIQFAKQNESEHLHFFVHDMRDPISDKHFDAVLNLFTSFAYFKEEEDNLKVLRSVASYLKPNGTFVLDFFNVDKALKDMKKHYKLEIDGIIFNIEKFYDGKFIHKKIDIVDGDVNLNFEEQVQALKKEDFENMLASCGFKIQEIFGDYNLSNFDPVNSDRLIIKAQLR